MAGLFNALGAGLTGAAGGFASGGPVGGIIGGVGSLVSGLLGSQPKVPKELQRLYSMQLSMARQQQQYANSIPLSDPQEQAALASQRGILGDQERQQMGQLQSQYGLINQGTNGAGDFLTNIYNQNQGQQSALTAGAMQNALIARRQALGQASGLASAAAGTIQGQYQQQSPLGPGFGELARLIAYNQTMHAASQQKPAAPNGSSSGPTQTSFNGAPMSIPPAGQSATGSQMGASTQGTQQPAGQIDWQALGASGLLGNPALAQVTPAQNTLNTALNR